MASRVKNITVDIGSDYIANVVAYANGSTVSPINLTSYTANCQVKKSYYHSNTVATFNVWIQDATAGIINLHLNSANTNALSPGNYVYDVMIQDPIYEHNTRVIEGVLTATPGVSK